MAKLKSGTRRILKEVRRIENEGMGISRMTRAKAIKKVQRKIGKTRTRKMFKQK